MPTLQASDGRMPPSHCVGRAARPAGSAPGVGKTPLPPSTLWVAVGTRAVAAWPLPVATTSNWYLRSSVPSSTVARAASFGDGSGIPAYSWLLIGIVLSVAPSLPRCTDDPRHPASAVAPAGGMRYRSRSCPLCGVPVRSIDCSSALTPSSPGGRSFTPPPSSHVHVWHRAIITAYRAIIEWAGAAYKYGEYQRFVSLVSGSTSSLVHGQL